MTHICVGKSTIIGSDNGLSPDRRQAIIWTNAGLLLIGPWGTNFSEILIEIHTFSFKKIRLKVSSGKWRPFCLGLNVLTHWGWVKHNASVNYTIIGSDNGLSPARHKNIIWINAGMLLIGPLGTNLVKFLSQLKDFHWWICIWKCRLPKWQPSCPSLNALNHHF